MGQPPTTTPAVSEPPTQPASRPRYRVVLVRLPESGQDVLTEALPGGRPIDPLELPLITRITGDRDAAHTTARRLREAGAVVVVTQEPANVDSSAFCGFHPHRLAPRTCARCGAPVCKRCQEQAGGEEICPRCHLRGHSRLRRTRLRQLFVFFLFAVFLYEVVGFLQDDRASVAPQGHVRAVVVQFVEPGGLGAPILRDLNLPHVASNGTSLHSIGPWFSQERARYDGPSDGWMQVDVRGPWMLDVQPPELDDPRLSGTRRLFNSWRWPRYFHDLAARYGVEVEDYGVRAYVVYGGSADMAAHSRGSKKGRIAVSWVALDEQNPGYAALTVAHEMGHALGAMDRYDPASFQAAYPEGYVEPYTDPLYPQRYAELMAVDVPLSLRTEREARSVDEVRIGYRTAAEMGWVPRERADLFYTPPAIGPMDRLPSREAALRPARPNPPPQLPPNDGDDEQP